MASDDFENEEPTVKITRETMREARERSVPAATWDNYEGSYGEGFAPSGPDRPTRDIRLPQPDEITAVDGVPLPIDSGDDTEPLRLDRVA